MSPMIVLCIAVAIALSAVVAWVVRSRQRRRALTPRDGGAASTEHHAGRRG